MKRFQFKRRFLFRLLAARLLAAWLLAAGRASPLGPATTSATILHGSLTLFLVQLAVAILVVLLKELCPAGTLGFLPLFFVQLAVAILVEFLEDFLGNLTGATTALARAATLAFRSLTTLGAGRTLFVTLVFIGKGTQGSRSEDPHDQGEYLECFHNCLVNWFTAFCPCIR